MFDFFKSFSNYLGDYSPQNIDHKQFEAEVIGQGADSGAPLYEYCVKVVDEKFSKRQPVKILDLACGRGPLGRHAKSLRKNYLVDGIDIFVPEKESLQEEGIYNKVIEEDILKFDFDTVRQQYDLIISNQFFEHLEPEDALSLLKTISNLGASILISVPLSYHTFAYSKDYLVASLKQNQEFSDLLSKVTDAGLHKTYFTKKLMKKYGFAVLAGPVYHSNFFYRDATAPMTGAINVKLGFKQVPAEEIESVWRQLIESENPSRPNLPKREAYEKKLIKALLMEPKSFKVIRKIIYLLTNPLRLALKFIRS